jgi:hypothetical protein
MKVFFESTLPLDARTSSERFVLSSLEAAATFRKWSLAAPVVWGILAWYTGIVWLLAPSVFWFINLFECWQARTLVSMIQRSYALKAPSA